MIKIISWLLLISFSFPSTAKSPLVDSTYVGVDYILSSIELRDERAKPSTTAFRIGANKERIGLEAQYLRGNNTDNIYRMEFDLEQSIALYLVLQSKTISGFGLDVSLGYAVTDMTVQGPAETYNGEDTYSGFSWGITFHQKISYIENTQLRFGYQSLYKDDDISISGISLGVIYQF
ncbi:outer membrane beta-barrel protein [Colwellia sp. 4_MG-2023]|jgi:hypothetical protein|uniref:outer membrane beta-barrel protein n=1 Tax=unclassified Colwellia TaxID=196834 RepID=UPI0026E1F41B|nr:MULTISPECIES: outer membrane beta-barrel protein [unclassified Colwellia]MDO6505462.1 outer membrane beta-barrel protein [Colwellia sp. 5_MG-2023]MDO6554242.1 outer membrane beta-barrel protein [Colwellia sp. 4_MG-2023]